MNCGVEVARRPIEPPRQFSLTRLDEQERSSRSHPLLTGEIGRQTFCKSFDPAI